MAAIIADDTSNIIAWEELDSFTKSDFLEFRTVCGNKLLRIQDEMKKLQTQVESVYAIRCLVVQSGYDVSEFDKNNMGQMKRVIFRLKVLSFDMYTIRESGRKKNTRRFTI